MAIFISAFIPMPRPMDLLKSISPPLSSRDTLTTASARAGIDEAKVKAPAIIKDKKILLDIASSMAELIQGNIIGHDPPQALM
jgi:hypothetical protein